MFADDSSWNINAKALFEKVIEMQENAQYCEDYKRPEACWGDDVVRPILVLARQAAGFGKDVRIDNVYVIPACYMALTGLTQDVNSDMAKQSRSTFRGRESYSGRHKKGRLCHLLCSASRPQATYRVTTPIHTRTSQFEPDKPSRTCHICQSSLDRGENLSL
jgi:hypothetical protein